jgi:hypothetical protein
LVIVTIIGSDSTPRWYMYIVLSAPTWNGASDIPERELHTKMVFILRLPNTIL